MRPFAASADRGGDLRSRERWSGICRGSGQCCHLGESERGCHGAGTHLGTCATGPLLHLSPQRVPACWKTARAASCALRTTAASPATTGSSCLSGGTASASTGCASTLVPRATLVCGVWRSTDAQVGPAPAGVPLLLPSAPCSPRHPAGPSAAGRAMASFPTASLVALDPGAAGLRSFIPFSLAQSCSLDPAGLGSPVGAGVPRAVPLTGRPSRQSAGRPAARAASAETSA